MERKNIEVIFSNNLQSLLQYNVLPTDDMYAEAKIEKNKYIFQINSNEKVVIEISTIGVIKKTILNKKETLLIPNYIRFVNRKSFTKQLEMTDSYEILEMRWFHNKRQYNTVSHGFMLSFADLHGFRQDFLVSPNSYERNVIETSFKKLYDCQLSTPQSKLESSEDLLRVLEFIETENEDPRILINYAKSFESYVLHRNFTGRSLPAQRIKFEESLKVNGDYSLEEVEIFYTEKGFVINKATFNYSEVIKFNMMRDETGFYLTSSGNSYGIGIENDVEGKYYAKINYMRHFPLKIQHIQLPLIFATLGQKHNFIRGKKESELTPKSVKNYREFPEFIKSNYPRIYASLLYFYRTHKKSDWVGLSKIINDEIEDDMLEEDLYYLLSLNLENFAIIYERASHNLKVYQKLSNAIDKYNAEKISILELNKVFEENAPKMKTMKS